MASSSTTPAAAEDEDVHYPESDGKPMGETGFHVDAILALHAAFLIAFRERPDVYIASDMFLYYERGNPRAVKAPDVMVIQGVGNQPRRTFKLWAEDAAPSTIFEVTSDETQREDATTKPEVYARIGVPEYFLFDPLGDYLDPQLQGYRLDGGRYTKIAPDAAGNLPSGELGLSFRAEGRMIRVIDGHTGEPILTGLETYDQLQQTIARARAASLATERLRRKVASEHRRAERLRKQFEQAQQEAERERAQAERAQQDAEHAQQDAVRERARAESLRAEVERLRAMLGGEGPGE